MRLRARRLLAPAALVLAGVASNLWVLSGRNFFIWDDYDWLQRAALWSYAAIFHVLPQEAYNDRPVGSIAIKMLYEVFGLHARKHHAVLLGLHIASAILLYLILTRLSGLFRLGSSYRALPFLGALLWACWPTATYLLGWDAAIFDTLGSVWGLSFIWLYLMAREERYPVFDTLALAGLYFLAVRTKEMTVALPLMVALIEVGLAVQERGWRIRLTRARTVRLAALLLLMLGYLAAVARAASVHPLDFPRDSPYFTSRNPLHWLIQIPRYVALYVDFNEHQFGFTGRLRLALLLTLPLLVFAGWGLLVLVRRRRSLPLVLVGLFLLTLAPVLPLVNVTHRLYLYMPSWWLATMAAFALLTVLSALTLRERRLQLAGAVVVAGLVLVALRSPTITTNREWFLLVGDENRRAITALERLPAPRPGQKVAIIDVDPAVLAYHPFLEHYGVVEPLRILFGDPSITGALYPQARTAAETGCRGCYVIDYDHADLRLVAR